MHVRLIKYIDHGKRGKEKECIMLFIYILGLVMGLGLELLWGLGFWLAWDFRFGAQKKHWLETNWGWEVVL